MSRFSKALIAVGGCVWISGWIPLLSAVSSGARNPVIVQTFHSTMYPIIALSVVGSLVILAATHKTAPKGLSA